MTDVCHSCRHIHKYCGILALAADRPQVAVDADFRGDRVIAAVVAVAGAIVEAGAALLPGLVDADRVILALEARVAAAREAVTPDRAGDALGGLAVAALALGAVIVAVDAVDTGAAVITGGALLHSSCSPSELKPHSSF